MKITGKVTRSSTFLLLLCISAWCGNVKPKPEDISEPSVLLDRSYAAGKTLPISERVFLMTRLNQVASEMGAEATRKWSKELFQLTSQMEPGWDQLALKKNALIALSRFEPRESVRQLAQFEAPVAMPEGGIPEDVRADSARTLFSAYWDKAGIAGLPLIRRAAQHLGETGQYPYLAMMPIISALHRDKKERISTELFTEAVSYYRHGTVVESADREFVDFLLQLDGSVPSALLKDAASAAVDSLTKPREKPAGRNYLYQADTDHGVVKLDSPARTALFELFPLIRKLDPDWSAKLAQDYGLSKDRGSVAPHAGEEGVIEGDVPQQQLSSLQQQLMEESRLMKLRGIDGNDPQQALSMAQTLSSPTLRAMGFAAAAGGLSSKDPAEAANLVDDGSKLLKQIPGDFDRLRVITSLAAAAGALGDLDRLDSLLDEGLRLGEQVVSAYREQHPDTTTYFAQGERELSSLVDVGTRYRKEATLKYVFGLRDQTFQAYMLVDAAHGLYILKSETKSAEAASARKAEAPTARQPRQ